MPRNTFATSGDTLALNPATGEYTMRGHDECGDTRDAQEYPMFAGKTLLQILSMGGFTMYILLLCSILSLGVIIDRLVSYGRKSRVKRPVFMDRIRDQIRRNDMERALEICRDA